MGQYVPTGLLAGKRGVYLNLNVVGNTSSGSWIQTWIDTDTAYAASDCGITCPSPFYPSAWSNGQWFFDAPDRMGGPVTWLAQASLLLPSGTAFTFQWGFTLANGMATPIGPVVAQPWASQQANINKGQGVQ
jgi:hypothetical protein